MTLRLAQFLEALGDRTVVYRGADSGSVTYRLSDGSVWRLTKPDARKADRAIGERSLFRHREEELSLLNRLMNEKRRVAHA